LNRYSDPGHPCGVTRNFSSEEPNKRFTHAVGAGRHGVIATRRLRDEGVSAPSINWWVQTGRLHPKYRGVYAIGRPDLSQKGEFLAAVLAIGDDAVLSYFAAAALWRFWNGRTSPIDVSVARVVRRRADIRVHRRARLTPKGVTVHDGIPVTTPAKTIVDLAGAMYSHHAFRRLVHEAQVQDLVTIEQLEAEAARAHPRTPGLEWVYREIAAGPTRTRSGFEDAVVERLRSEGFPPFQTNVRPAGTPRWVEVDIQFVHQRFVIELDGDRWHSTPFRKAFDARKQQILEAAGYELMRAGDDEELDQIVARAWDVINRYGGASGPARPLAPRRRSPA
jgi:very-short-patch-repair endonuclease